MLDIKDIDEELQETAKMYGLSKREVEDCFNDSLATHYKATHVIAEGRGLSADGKYFSVSEKAYSKVKKLFYENLMLEYRRSLRSFLKNTIIVNNNILYCSLAHSYESREYYQPYINKTQELKQLYIVNDLTIMVKKQKFPEYFNKIPIEIQPILKKKTNNRYIARGTIITQKTVEIHLLTIDKKLMKRTGFPSGLIFRELAFNSKTKEYWLNLTMRKENVAIIKFAQKYFKSFELNVNVN